MATQPLTELPASIPPAQTNVMVLQQAGIIPRPIGVLPGDGPNMLTELARAQWVGSVNLKTDDVPGTLLNLNSNVAYPTLPVRAEATAGIRNEAAYSCQFYFHLNTYYNADVVLHFWAIKPPAAIGRIRVTYTPPLRDLPASDGLNREITESWDLSASNLFEFKIPNYNMRSYKQCMANSSPLNGTGQTTRTIMNDYKMGYVRLFVTHQYQPGSIFPSNCNIHCFQSFQNPQFAINVGPSIAYERTCLTRNNNPT